MFDLPLWALNYRGAIVTYRISLVSPNLAIPKCFDRLIAAVARLHSSATILHLRRFRTVNVARDHCWSRLFAIGAPYEARTCSIMNLATVIHLAIALATSLSICCSTWWRDFAGAPYSPSPSLASLLNLGSSLQTRLDLPLLTTIGELLTMFLPPFLIDFPIDELLA